MTQKQIEILEKEFDVFGIPDSLTITRSTYETLPCAMLAWNWSDEQMEELAKNIN